MVNHTTIADVVPVLASMTRAGLRPSQPCHRDGCGTAHGHIRFLATELVFTHPILGPIARRSGFIPVGWQRSAHDPLRSALAALDRGEIVGIYPEGDVSANEDGSPRQFRTGAARLALHTGAPVVPVAQHDSRVIGHGSVAATLAGALRSVARRPVVRLAIGDTIRAADYAGRTVQEVSALLREGLTTTWQTLTQA